MDAATVYTDFNGLAALRREAGTQSPEAVAKVARQFEAVFVQMLLKSMRAATPGDGLTDSDATRMARDLHDQQLALDLSKRGIGIADLLTRQLLGRDAPAATPNGRGVPAPDLAVLRQVERIRARGGLAEAGATSAVPFKADSPEAFVRGVWPHAQAAARELGVRPEVLVAQAALESGWGRAVPRHADGRSSHNLFGIKADRGWSGPKVVANTLEYENGVPVRRDDGFRAYASYGESFRDYARFVRDNPRYARALDNAADSRAYLRELHRAGYATDPGYAGKIERLLDGGPLGDFLDALGAGVPARAAAPAPGTAPPAG